MLKNQVRCAYVKTANTADAFGSSSALDPTQDINIIGGASPIFTAADFKDSDIAKTATVMKLVLNGYAGAGTITLGALTITTARGPPARPATSRRGR